MIPFTKYIIETGQITGHLWVTITDDVALNDAKIPAHEAFINGYWLEGEVYIRNGEIVDRPTTGLPETHSIAASTDWILSDIPEGTEVEVDGVILGTTDATGLTLSFDAPGIWPVTLRPPFPWIEASCEVTVT